MKTYALIGAAAAALLAAAPASADTLAISGKIDYQCDLTLAGQNSGTINLRSTQHPLGQFNVKCNDPDGFAVTITSANGGSLTSGSYAVSYKLKANGVTATDLNFGDTALNSPINKQVSGFSPAHAAAAGADYAIQMQAYANNPLPGGVSLSDTLTFTITGL